MENLHRDRYQKDISEEKWGEQVIVENLHRDFSKQRQGMRGKELEQRSEQQVSEDRRGDRVQRTYIGIYIRKTSLKRDGETENGDPT